MADWTRAIVKAPENAKARWLPDVFREAVNQTSATRQGAFIGAGLIEEFAGKPYADLSNIAQIAVKFASFKAIDALEWAARMERKPRFDSDPPETGPLAAWREPGTLLAAAISGVSDQDLRAAAEWCRNRPPGAERNVALSALINRAGTVDQALVAELEQVVRSHDTGVIDAGIASSNRWLSWRVSEGGGRWNNNFRGRNAAAGRFEQQNLNLSGERAPFGFG